MQVDYSGTVVSRPVFFYSKHSHHVHEQFDVRGADGATFRVVDNVSISPRVPAQPGDHVAVRGDLLHVRGQPPLVHWTHHDPGGRHRDGFVELGGRVYA